MLHGNSIFKNSSFLILGNLSQRILSFFTIVLISRYLGPARYGQYSFVISLVTIAAVFWNFGLNTVLTRDIAAKRSRAATYMSQAVLIKTVFFFVFFIGMFFYVKWSRYDCEIVTPIVLFALGMFISTINEIFRTVFSAFRRMEFSALLNVIRSLVVLIGVLFVSHLSEHNLVLVFVAYLLGFITVNLLSLFILKKKFVLPEFSASKEKIKYLLIQAKPFVLIAAADIILFRVDHLMLSRISGDIELGFYGAAYTLFEIIISLFPMMIMGAAFPVLSDKFNNDIEGFKAISNIIIKLFLYLGLPMSCGLILLGNDICFAVYGSDFVASGRLLAILGFSIWMFFLTGFLGWALTAMRLQKYVLRATFIAMLLNIAGNLIAIPIFGAKGAALITVCCELFQLLFLLYCFRSNILIDYSLRFGSIFCSTALMAFSVYFIIITFVWDNLVIKLISAVVVGIIVFAITTIPFKIITRKEILLIRKI